jgi:hypothetical protein
MQIVVIGTDPPTVDEVDTLMWQRVPAIPGTTGATRRDVT